MVKKLQALTGDFSPNIIAVLFSLIDNACIIVPFSDNSEDDNLNKYNISQVEHLLTCDDNDKIIAKRISLKSDNKYYKVLRKCFLHRVHLVNQKLQFMIY